MLGGGQAVCGTTAHAPVAGLQHAPGHGLGEQIPPGMNTFGAAQFASDVIVHTPFLQHAPVHGFGLQEPLAGPHVPVHCDCTVMKHPPLAVQHGPGGGHGLKKHSPGAGMKPAGQTVPVTIVHAPVVTLQHAVIEIGHSTWAHVEPGVALYPLGQLCPTYTWMHEPFWTWQHAVTHGFGVQEAPCTHEPLQLFCVVCVHRLEP